MAFVLENYLEERKALVEEAIEAYLPFKQGKHAHILKAMRYSLLAGGKRLRPILCLAATEAVGGKIELALPVACALEMIHTYSLIHDDLPAIDNDDFRRRKPTNHKVFGEGMAILSGDGLLTEAFYLLTHPNLVETIPLGHLLQVIHLIAETASFRGMVGGQAMDIRAGGKRISFRKLEAIHRHKTGALIVTSVKTGAIIGNGSKIELKTLAEYATNIGLAFQIVDDILDIEGNPKEMGKNIGRDIAQQKATYPHLLGLSRSKEIVEICVKRAINALEFFGKRAIPLSSLAQYIKERRN
jgi:geranylgeranyl diphosphate synthase type II